MTGIAEKRAPVCPEALNSVDRETGKRIASCKEVFPPRLRSVLSASVHPWSMKNGGERGIRTPGTGFSQYGGLANHCFRPLSHLSGGMLIGQNATIPVLPTQGDFPVDFARKFYT